MSDLSQQASGRPSDEGISHAASRLTSEQYRVLTLSAMGGMLEYYEFTIFIFLSPFISQVFLPRSSPAWLSELQTLVIFAAGYLTRPFGGIILSSLGDRLGRKRMFALSVLIMAAPTLIIGLLPGYQRVGFGAPAALLICRLLQGVALGGELPTAMVFVSEHVPQRRLGFAFGVIGASVVLGFVVASGLIREMTMRFSHEEFADYAWRIPFLAGGCFGFLSAFLRRYVSETPVFREMSIRKMVGSGNPLTVLIGRYRRETLLCLVLSIVPGVVIPGVHIFPAVYLETFRNFDGRLVSNGLFWLQITMLFSCIAGGVIVDRVGWKRAIITTLVLLVVAIFCFYGFIRPATVTIWFVVLGVLLSGLTMLYSPLVFSFPAQIRLTGISTVYNIGAAIFGGTTPIVMQLLAHRGGWGVAMYPAIALLTGVAVVPALWKLRKPLFAIDE
ncbi:MFS transporter [Paraburkholderia hospita]|nr:MFS transporter [Paraburkholderia hospita]